MTASRPSRALAALFALAGGTLLGCRTPGAIPYGSALEPDLHHAVLVPDVADTTAAEVAAAALVSDREEAVLALERLEDIDTVLLAFDESPTGLAPVARDLVNTTVDDDRRYREATRQLLAADDLDPALRGRLRQAAEDDPLLLAQARMRDSYLISFGRAFNAVAEPLGRSIMTTSMAPYRLGRALLGYLAEVYRADPLPLQERQALAHWKDFLALHPDAAEAPELSLRVDEAEAEWRQTQRNHAVRAAEAALERNQIRLALVYADRALDYVPEDDGAAELRDEAAARLTRQRTNRTVSVGSVDPADGGVAPPRARPLAVALLLPDGDVESAARALLASAPDGPLADEATFALATARGEHGDEDGMWRRLGSLASEDMDRVNMARHAAALYDNPDENSFRAFEQARRRNAVDSALWVVFGPFYRGLPDRGLPEPLGWALDVPAAAESVMGSPMRLIQLPWTDALPAEQLAAHYAYAYLDRRPHGEHAAELRKWLEDYESDRGNWVGAYRIAEERTGVRIEELDEYREKAARQSLGAATRPKRRDVRLSMMRSVAQEFPDTAAGRQAGKSVRHEVANATEQRIRISRGFLTENPEVAGPGGLGLRPELLDDDAANGELHPEGLVLLSGTEVVFYYVGPSGDGDDPPLSVHERIDADRLARLVSALEEASFENSLVDADDPVEANAQRDVFFERARLGLADEADHRATAHAEFAYRGMRERYGMVRSRESILPFDLVVKGSLSDLSFGAFPRIRKPRETPDAFLYR